MTPNFKKYNKYEQYDNDGYIISVVYTPKKKYNRNLCKVKWTYNEREDLWLEEYEDREYHSPDKWIKIDLYENILEPKKYY